VSRTLYLAADGSVLAEVGIYDNPPDGVDWVARFDEDDGQGPDVFLVRHSIVVEVADLVAMYQAIVATDPTDAPRMVAAAQAVLEVLKP
jgi:hypothetical protein